MLISLFPTPFGHFQFLGSAGQNPNLILTLCHMQTNKCIYFSAQILFIYQNYFLLVKFLQHPWSEREFHILKALSNTFAASPMGRVYSP